MLFKTQRRSFGETSSQLDNDELYDDGEDFYYQEQPIVEESLEHIIFILFEFSAVDLIEYL